MLDLYYWPTPNGWKITIFLEEAGVPYNVKPLNIAKGEQFTDEFLKINPNHRMPAIVEHHETDGTPLAIDEKAAILICLA
jgi:GST-like protein